jgi:hypothetical protein
MWVFDLLANWLPHQKNKTPNYYVGGLVVCQGLTPAFARDMDKPGERVKGRYWGKQENE